MTAAIAKRFNSPASSDASCGKSQWHKVMLEIQYRTAFLSVFDHAPDASRGVDIPPAVATLVPASCVNVSSSIVHPQGSHEPNSPAGSPAAARLPVLERLKMSCGVQRQYSSSAGGTVVPLPLPDFSMPFNVICFTSTLLAVLLGGVVNVVLRWVLR